MTTSSVLPVIIRGQYDSGSGFSEMVQEAQRASGQIKRQFDQNFSEIGRMAQQALAIPRNASGALDLNTAQYRQAALDAEAYAQSLREIATASAAAAVQVGDNSNETRRYVQAARAASIEAERQAREATETANAYDRLQQQLDQTRSATERVVEAQRQGTTANGAVTNSNRAMRTAMVQSGQQLQDIAIQFQAGTRSSTILAQQLPQLAFAFSGVGGRVGTVARILSGPWSLALVAGSALLGTYIDDLLKGDEASDKLKEKTISLTDALAASARGTDEARKALEEYNDTQDRARDNAEYMIKVNLAAAASNIQEAISIREKTKATIEFLLADSRRPSQSEAGDVRQRGAASLASQLQADVARQDAELGKLAQTARNLLIDDAKREAEGAADPLKAINNLYDDMAAKAEKAAAGNNKLAVSLKGTLSGIETQRKAALDAQRATDKAGGGTGSGAQARVGDMVALIKQLFPNARITSTTRNDPGSDHDRKVARAIDFVVPGMMNSAGTLEVERRLEEAGVDIRRNAKGTKQFFGPGRGAAKPGDHDDHFHAAWKGSPDPERAQRATEQAAKKSADEAFRLAEFAADADDRIGRMRQSFEDTPPAIAQMLSGMATLDDLASDIERQIANGLDPKAAGALKAKLEELRPVIEDSVNQPFKDMVRSAEEAAQVQDLLIAGRQDEAEVLSRIFDLEKQQGDLTAGQVDVIRDIVAGERLRSRELEKQNELRQREVELIEGTRDNIRDTMQSLARGGGVGAIGALFKRQFDLVLENAVDSLFEKAFGDFFRDEKDKALGFDKVRQASDRQVSSINKTVTALEELQGAVRSAATHLDPEQNPSLRAGQAANDNSSGLGSDGEIVVVANKDPEAGKTPRDFLGLIVSSVADVFLDSSTAKRIGEGISKGLNSESAAYGAIAGGFIGGATGSKIGAGLGALADIAGKGELFTAISGPLAAASAVNSLIGDIFGFEGGPLGIFTSLVTSVPRASSTIGGSGSSLGVTSTRGTSSSLRKASSGAAGEAIDTLDRIAEALGATIDASLGSVSIGMRKGNYRVDTSGSGITKTSKGAIDFGEDSAAAIRAAAMDLIKDGVLVGLRDSTRRLLQEADDLDKAIKDALDFEGVFTRLKEIKDPVGAALDSLNKEFERLIGLFQRAGASTEEFAALEELYGLERAKAMKDASESLVGPLRDLIADLETGDNGLSLRARRQNALAEFNPLAEAIRSGQTVDYNEFTDAARTLLEISRELFGSQDEYFATFNDILNLSKTALAGQENVVSISDASPSPFISVDTVPVVQAVDAQSQMLLSQSTSTNDLLQEIRDLLRNGGVDTAAVVNGNYF